MSNQVFNKKDWEKVKFGDISKEVRVSEKEPLKNGIERYVGLEHIESEDLHIRSWGDVADGTTFIRKFTKGQLLFGRRRAYLRKAAVADFDGICSGDILVFEANTEMVLTEFFPFIIQNDKFFNFAVDESAGSLSPRVKYKDLAEYEFLLPPLAEQKKLADLLWAGDEALQMYRELEKEIQQYRGSFLKTFLKKNKKFTKLRDLDIELISGLWKGTSENQKEVTVIRNTEFSKFGYLDLSNPEKVMVDVKSYKNKQLQRGDIIVEMSGGSPTQPVGRVVYFDIDGGDYSFSNFTKVIRSKNIDPYYLFVILQFAYEQNKTERMQKQTTGIRNLDLDIYSTIKIPVMSGEDQENFVAEYKGIESIRLSVIDNSKNVIKINKSLINQIFG